MISPYLFPIYDIPLLVSHFIDKYKEREGGKIEEIEPEALDNLANYDWPGNVRELENVIERAVLLEEGRRISRNSLPSTLIPKRHKGTEVEAFMEFPYKKALENATDHFAKTYLKELLMRFRGNVTKASSHAGMERESLHRLMRKYDIRSEEFKD
jgi:two-component system response regulator AtoC